MVERAAFKITIDAYKKAKSEVAPDIETFVINKLFDQIEKKHRGHEIKRYVQEMTRQ